MKNTLFHFGDSFGCWENGHRDGNKHTTKGYSNYVAEHFNLNHEHRAEESLSNAQIISRIITEIPNFKKGDFVLINWSFFDRFPVMTEPHKEGKIISLNSLITEEDAVQVGSYTKEYLDYNILHRTDVQKEEWNLLFWLFLKPSINTISRLGCNIFVSFNNSSYPNLNFKNNIQYLLNGCNISTNNPNYKLLMNILTEDYIRDLKHNKWNSDDDGCAHYKKGIQKELGTWWIDKINETLK